MAHRFSGGYMVVYYFCLTNGICKFVGLFSGLSKARPSTFLLPLKACRSDCQLSSEGAPITRLSYPWSKSKQPGKNMSYCHTSPGKQPKRCHTGHNPSSPNFTRNSDVLSYAVCRNPIAYSEAYSPLRCKSSAWVPCSAIRPACNTTMLSAPLMVERR